MSVLIAAGSTSAELTLAAGDAVTLVLVPTTASGLPSGAKASIAWAGADHDIHIASLGLSEPATVLSAPGAYVVTKGAGSYSVERSD